MSRLLNTGWWFFRFRCKELAVFVAMLICNGILWRPSWELLRFDLPDAESLSIPQLIIDLAKRKKWIGFGHRTCGQRQNQPPGVYCGPDQHGISFPCHYFETRLSICIIIKRALIIKEKSRTTPKLCVRHSCSIATVSECCFSGWNRDLETIPNCVNRRREQDSLVLSSLHTIGAAKTIDRISMSSRPINSNKSVCSCPWY